MAAPPSPTSADAPTEKRDLPATKSGIAASDSTRQERKAVNQEMVKKYHAMFPKIPTMTSEELVAHWKEIDRFEDERDDSQNSSDSDDDTLDASFEEDENSPSPLLLIDVRTKAERNVSMLQGAVAMEDHETTRWINKYVHEFDGKHKGGKPTIVTYCTVGYRSGREAQWLIDDLTSTYGIEIGKSVDIKNLDGILAYSFVEDAPPLLRPCRKGSSDSFMTRRIHSYGKEWSEAVDPSFETVHFDSKPKMAMHLVRTGLASAVRMVQHQIHKSTTKARETTSVVAETVVEPVANLAGASIKGESSSVMDKRPSKRISATGYTSNQSTTDSH
jgi:rhodanese-related sulfurtransferase